MRYRIFGMLSVLCFVHPVSAQQAPPPTPEHPTQDENGVDVAEWDHVYYHWSPISIGTPDQGGLSLEYYEPSTGRSNFTADLRVPDTNFPKTVATFGSNTVTSADFVHDTSQPGSGASCSSSTCSYSLRDGTRVDYFIPSNFDSLPGNGSYIVYPAKVTFPSGEVWTYHNIAYYPPSPYLIFYAVRPQSITSNRGYQVKFYYQSDTIGGSPTTWSPWWGVNKISLINNAYEYCNPDADSCSLSMNWPSVTFSSSFTGSVFTVTVTNDQGYQYKFVNTSLGSGLGKYQVFTPRSTGETFNYITESYQHPDDVNNPYVLPGNLRTRVKSFTRDGKTWNYNYAFSYPYGTLTRVAPDATSRKFHVQLSLTTFVTTPAKVDWMQNELGNISNYTYDDWAFILTAQKPEGNSQQVIYDDRGNVTQSTSHAKPGSSLADITLKAIYPTSCTYTFTYAFSCNKPSAVIDANNGQTDFTYDNAHGGILSEMGPAPTLGAARPLTLTSWAQRYAWIKNSSGSLVQAPSPVWVKATETRCQTVAGSNSPVCNSAAQQTVTTYEYGAAGGPDGLLIKGIAVSSGEVTLRTCYSYDRYARKISETRPNANLGVCP